MKLMEAQMLAALKMQVQWKMRDGSSCACPAGKNEDGIDSKGKMPTRHSTACEMLRTALHNYSFDKVED